MKFCKKYQEYMQGQDDEKKQQLPRLGFKNLKKLLKRCSRSHPHHGGGGSCSCSGCDEKFFPSLAEEMSSIVGCFNERAERLITDLHLGSSALSKCLIWFTAKFQGSNHGDLIRQGDELVTYALINAVALRKILKKYDKIHYSKQGQAFKTKAQSMHIEILHSPWLCELMAFHINLRGTANDQPAAASNPFQGSSLTFHDEHGKKPSLSCDIFESIKVDIDLTCSICLETVFDPVSLRCGHIFCYICACSAASVTIVDGLESADPRGKCPLCRETGVFEGAVHLEELNILLSQSCKEYWEERLQSERQERVKQAKQHWETQTRAFMGI
ncbi:E3 ubiquitin-protein ligase BAH1 [Linum grandiflorum]